MCLYRLAEARAAQLIRSLMLHSLTQTNSHLQNAIHWALSALRECYTRCIYFPYRHRNTLQIKRLFQHLRTTHGIDTRMAYLANTIMHTFNATLSQAHIARSYAERYSI